MTDRGRIACRSRFFFFDFYLEGFMNRITIKSIAILLVFGLAVCSSLRNGSGPGEKDSTGGLNGAQFDNSQAPGAQNVNQQATDTKYEHKLWTDESGTLGH